MMGLNYLVLHHGGEDKEWELFDCKKDPLELLNIYTKPEYLEIVSELTFTLEKDVGNWR